MYDQTKYYESNKNLSTNISSESQNILKPPQQVFLTHQFFQDRISSSYDLKTKNSNEIINFQHSTENNNSNNQNVYYDSHQNNFNNRSMKYQGYNYSNNMNNPQYLINTNDIQYQNQSKPVQNNLNQYYTQPLLDENSRTFQTNQLINPTLPNTNFPSSNLVLNSNYTQVIFLF